MWPDNLAAVQGANVVVQLTANVQVSQYIHLGGDNKQRLKREVSSESEKGSLQMHVQLTFQFDKVVAKIISYCINCNNTLPQYE